VSFLFITTYYSSDYFLELPNDCASAAPHLRYTLILAENTKSHFLDSRLAPWASAAGAGWTRLK
jgi:hypothetical protein